MEPLIPDGAKTAIAIFAHPDDEVLWAGGLILSRPDLEWMIVCCTVPVKDPVRAEKYHTACTALGAHSVLLPYKENEGLIRFDEIPDLSYFDVVLTHGAAGEYGHVQHKELHQLVKDIPLLEYQVKRYVGYNPENRPATWALPLNDLQWGAKQQALMCYNHISPVDHGLPKWEALLNYYGSRFNLRVEQYD